MELTKDAEKLASMLYQEYKKRRKSKMPKESAKMFDGDWTSLFPKENAEDLKASLREIKKNFNLKSYTDGTFFLSSELIAHEEEKPVKTVEKVINAVLKLKP